MKKIIIKIFSCIIGICTLFNVVPIYAYSNEKSDYNESTHEQATYYNGDEHILTTLKKFYENPTNVKIFDSEGVDITDYMYSLSFNDDQELLNYFKENISRIESTEVEVPVTRAPIGRVYTHKVTYKQYDGILYLGYVEYQCQISVTEESGTGVVTKASVSRSNVLCYPSRTPSRLYGLNITAPWVSSYNNSTVNVTGGLYEVGYFLDTGHGPIGGRYSYNHTFYI